jgi:hypothetical protein
MRVGRTYFSQKSLIVQVFELLYLVSRVSNSNRTKYA